MVAQPQGSENAECEEKVQSNRGAAPCRLIVFLQQSSVEWCSSLWMHLVAEVCAVMFTLLHIVPRTGASPT